MLNSPACEGAHISRFWYWLVIPTLALVVFPTACALQQQQDLTIGDSVTTASAAHIAKPDADWQVAGTSVQGRHIRIQSLGSGPRKVLYIGGIHGDEPEGERTTAALPAAFLSSGLGEAVALTIIEDANPDGRAAKTRENANGVDINRNFPASNFDHTSSVSGGTPLSQPEAQVLHDLIEKVRPDLVVAMHSWNGRQFVNFDGPAESIAVQFSKESGLPVSESNSLAATPGSLGSYVGRDRGIPVITIELMKGSDPQINWELVKDPLIHLIGGR